MAPVMKENGKKISNTVKELKDGPMVLVTLVSISMVRSMEKGSLFGLIKVPILVNSMTTILRVMVSMSGQMVVSSMEIGSQIKWKAMVLSLGLMVESTLASIMMT